jgi:hypothetical protein
MVLDRMRLQEDGGGLACFLNQPGHVVGEPLGVADFETEGLRRLKLSLTHPELHAADCLWPPQDEIATNDTMRLCFSTWTSPLWDAAGEFAEPGWVGRERWHLQLVRAV